MLRKKGSFELIHPIRDADFLRFHFLAPIFNTFSLISLFLSKFHMCFPILDLNFNSKDSSLQLFNIFRRCIWQSPFWIDWRLKYLDLFAENRIKLFFRKNFHYAFELSCDIVPCRDNIMCQLLFLVTDRADVDVISIEDQSAVKERFFC